MDKEAIKQEIAHIINIKNNVWTGLVVSISGSITILFNLDSKLKFVFLIIGVILSIIFFYSYFKQSERIENLINKLKEQR